MRKIIFLTSNREPAQGCLDILTEVEQRHMFDLKALASDTFFLENSMKAFGKKIIFFESSKRNEEEICQVIKEHKIDLLISVQYKWVISKKMIDAVNGFAFNIHFGKLPDYRGHHMHIYPILNGEKELTTTLHWMVPEVDRGFIAFEQVSPIKDDDTSWSLMQKATNDTTRLFRKFIACFVEDKEIPRIPIKGKGHFYSTDSISKLKEISSIADFDEVDRKSRAFYYPPHEPAYFVLNGQKFYVIPKPYYNK